jgi:hypothetical protein
MKVLHEGKDILLDSEFSAYCKVLAQRATKDMPDWKEIRIDEFWQALASNKPFVNSFAGWEPDATSKWKEIPTDDLGTPCGLDRIAFGIIRTTEAKPKRGKKAEQIKLLAKYAAELSSELSATRAMLAELQREILELSKDAPIPTTFDIETIRQSWFSEGWDDGAAAMYKAALNAEAVLIYEVNGGEMDMQAAMGAARVVGAVQNALSTGMLTGE